METKTMHGVRVSLCMIVKNEEAGLPTCLASAAGLVDEIVIVDTGSTDRTCALAASYGARVYPFPWVDDFSAARNESLRHAAGDWIFWLDGDEWIDEANRVHLSGLIASLGNDNAAYVMTQRCLRQSSLTGPATAATKDVEQIRLFRRLPGVHWQYRVYEQVLPSVQRLGGVVRPTSIILQHPGYEDPTVHRCKIERNLRLARLDLAEHPESPYINYTLGVFEQQLGNFAESIPFLERGRERLEPNARFGANLHALLVQAYRRLSQDEHARAACAVARRCYPRDPDLLFQEGLLRQEAGDLQGAANSFLQILEDRPDRPAVPAPAELREAARTALNTVYQVQNRTQGMAVEALLVQARGHFDRKEFPAARQVLEQAIALAPQALMPRLALSHVLLREDGDSDAVEKALRDVLALDPSHAEARHNLKVFQQRRHLTGG
jgi:tetratricopeptide (TPR) repeat protein